MLESKSDLQVCIQNLGSLPLNVGAPKLPIPELFHGFVTKLQMSGAKRAIDNRITAL